jgi:hypothetical protein
MENEVDRIEWLDILTLLFAAIILSFELKSFAIHSEDHSMSFRILRLFGAATLSLCLAWSVQHVEAQDEQSVAEIRIESKKLSDAFNAGKAGDVAAMFLSSIV